MKKYLSDNFNNAVNWRSAIDSVLSNTGSNVLGSNLDATAADVLLGSGYTDSAITQAVRDAAFEAKDAWLKANQELSDAEKNSAVIAILANHGINVDANTYDY